MITHTRYKSNIVNTY